MNADKGFLNEESGKTSFTRVSGLLFFIVWALFSGLNVYLAALGDGMSNAADRAQEVAFWAFLGAVAPNLLKKLLERALTAKGAENAK